MKPAAPFLVQLAASLLLASTACQKRASEPVPEEDAGGSSEDDGRPRSGGQPSGGGAANGGGAGPSPDVDEGGGNGGDDGTGDDDGGADAGDDDDDDDQGGTPVDRVPPRVALASAEPALTSNKPLTVSVTFDEPVFGFAASDVSLSTGSVSSFRSVGASGAVFAFEAVPPAAYSGVLTVAVGRGVAADRAGNANTAAPPLEFLIDGAPPVVDAGPDRDAAGVVTLDARASDVDAATWSWAQVSGPAAATLASPQAHATTATTSADGVYVFRVVAADQVGNAASDDVRIAWDVTPPAVGGITVVAGYGTSRLDIAWPPASDSSPVAGAVTYRACLARDDVLTSVAAMEGPACTVVADWAPSLVSASAAGLLPHTRYYLRVAARDAAGHVALYDKVTTSTPAVSHVVYQDKDLSDFKHATDESGRWVVTTVDADHAGAYGSVAIDSAGEPRATYVRSSRLYYARRNSGSWTTTRLNPAGQLTGAVSFTSLALGRDDVAHVAFHEAEVGLGYATDATGDWRLERVHRSRPGEVTGQYASLAVDEGGVPHAAWLFGSAAALLVSARDGGTWPEPLAVDTAGMVGQWTSTAVDGRGATHVSYYDFQPGRRDAKYASDASGTWQTRTIDAGGTVGQYGKIALHDPGDGRTVVHMVYYDATRDDLRHATCANDPSAESWCAATAPWTVESLVTSAIDGAYVGLDVDAFGTVYVSYFDLTDTSLRFLRGRAGSWETSVEVDGPGTVGRWSSLAVFKSTTD